MDLKVENDNRTLLRPGHINVLGRLVKGLIPEVANSVFLPTLFLFIAPHSCTFIWSEGHLGSDFVVNVTSSGETGGGAAATMLTLLSGCCNRILRHISSDFYPPLQSNEMKWFVQLYCIIWYLHALLDNKYIFIVISIAIAIVAVNPYTWLFIICLHTHISVHIYSQPFNHPHPFLHVDAHINMIYNAQYQWIWNWNKYILNLHSHAQVHFYSVCWLVCVIQPFPMVVLSPAEKTSTWWQS